jgi:hypothetical protein
MSTPGAHSRSALFMRRTAHSTVSLLPELRVLIDPANLSRMLDHRLTPTL